MSPARPGRRLTLWFCMRDRAGHHSLMIEFLKRARHAGLAGATVFEASEGYGASGRLHRTHLGTDDAPVAVVFVDSPEQIEAFLETIVDLLDGVLAVVVDVEILGPAE